MIEDIWSNISWLLGLEIEGKDLDVWRMMLRAAIVFIAAIVMIRIGDKRFMGRNTALDVMLGIVFGSVISRAITGNAPFFPTLGAGIVLVAMHWILSATAFYADGFGKVIKGKRTLLVRDGEILWDAMKGSHISERDIKEAMRNSGNNPDIAQIHTAHLERNGDISIVTAEK
ncbi:MAG: DUF421 domain-containing protein [Acidobacteriota bacterium]|nr:DUF421 domain-containing protein [Acidobacteriota bacterium]